MKQPIVIHAIWAIVAVIAFAVGSKQFTRDGSTVAGGDEVRESARYGERSGVSRRAGEYEQQRGLRARDAAGGSVLASKGTIRLTAKDIEDLGKTIQTSRDPIERRHAFSELLKGLTLENAELLREQIVHMSSGSAEWREFHYAWGSIAGEVAVQFGAESEKTDMAACFSGWASADPEAAMAWFDNQSDDQKNRGDLKWGAVYGLANTDTELATKFVEGRLAMEDKDAGRMMNLVAESVLRSGDIGEATRWSANLPEGVMRDVAVGRVARDFASEDPVGAIAWLESLPGGSGQSRGMSAAFSSWAVRDAEAAAERINRMGSSPVRDSAVRGYLSRVAHRDPGTAIEWAYTIGDVKSRNEALVRYGRVYMHRDRKAATRWLASSNLSPELQQRIRSSSKRR